MSHLSPGLIGAYNSLTDKHLIAYFNNVRIRRHLQRVGLISRSGRIVSEKEFRYKIIHRDQQRHVRECLAQAIFHRVLDMERLHQTEIRKKLEEFARRERVNKMKVERCNRYEDDPLIFLSPRPPTRLRSSHAQHSGAEREPSDSTDSLGSSRPNTAPEKTQRPIRLKPLNSNSTPTEKKRNSSHSRNHDLTNGREQPISCTLDRDVMRHLTLTDFSSAVSPYRLPVINNFVTPIPPLKKKDKVQNGTLRGRRLRLTTAPNEVPGTKEGGVQQAWSQSAVWVKMVYFGKSLHLSHGLMELKDEVKVFQQHCGGENLCVYKGRLKEGESFQFVSRRHCGFPFSLTFYLNGLQVERLSSCCEFKHRKNSRLGGRHAHFGFSGVEGATPCYRCIIAMGLDKKPTPPKRIRNYPLVSKYWENEEEEEKHLQSESSQNTNREHKHKNGYEEDFEADDEGPMDDGVDEGNETSPSLSREEQDKRKKVRGSSSISSGLTSSSSSSEEDEDKFDKEQKEEEVTPKQHTAALTSKTDAEEVEFLQMSSVSLPNDDVLPKNHKMEHTDQEDREAEQPKEEPQEAEEARDETEEHEKPRNDPGEDEEPTDASGETDEPREEPREAEEPREEPGETKNAREEPGEDEKPREELNEGAAGDVNKEADQTKSVQEKLAEAILKMTGCVSEPELSDTTTEEDEFVSVVSQRACPVAEPESNMAQHTGAEPLREAEREEGHTEELEKEAHEPQQPETKTEEGEKVTNQTEVKTQNTAKEDEGAQDKHSGDDENEVQMMLKSKKTFGQKLEKEATSENSANAEEIRAMPVEEELKIMEEITELHLDNPEETAMDNENLDQKTETERVNDKGLSGGKEVSAEDKISMEVKGDEEKTFDESRNLRTNVVETGHDVREGIMEDTELELKDSSVNMVKNEDVAGEDEKSEERLEVSEIERGKEQREGWRDGDGVPTDMRDGMEEAKDQDPQVKEEENTEKGNKDEEMTEDRAAQKEPTSAGQSSEDKVDDVGQRKEEREEELAAEKDAELKDEQKSGSKGKDTEEDQHEEELKGKESLKKTDVGENGVDDMSDGAEERTDVGGADTEMQKIVMQKEEENKEVKKENSFPTVHEALQENMDGPEVKPGEIKAENREEIITLDKEKHEKKEEPGPEEGEGTSETNEKEIYQDMTKEEGVKNKQRDDENEKKEEDQRIIQKETTNEEEEEEQQQKADEEEIEHNVQQDPTNEEEVKDELKNEAENFKPLISENSINVATEGEAPSEAKTPAEDQDMNVDLESRGEEESRAGDGNHIQSATDIKKDKSADAAEETRSLEGSTSPSEESQPLEKVLSLKKEEREAELIIAPRTDHEELVSSWINIHQASNYFETFVEPLDEIKILDGERTVNTEALEIDETIQSLKESHRNEGSSETTKDEKISMPVNSEHEELEDMMMENFNMETEALGAEDRRNPFPSNPSEKEENRRQTVTDQPQVQEYQEDAAVNNIMKFSATPLMKFEISQDS